MNRNDCKRILDAGPETGWLLRRPADDARKRIEKDAVWSMRLPTSSKQKWVETVDRASGYIGNKSMAVTLDFIMSIVNHTLDAELNK